MSKVNEGILKQPSFHVKDPGSALTHFIAMVLAVVFTPPLLIHAANRNIGMGGMTSLAVFMESMVLLYAASSAYHTFNLTEKGNRLLKKLDHMMIFILIAGTYTPVCVFHLWGHGGGWLMAAVWGLDYEGELKIVDVNIRRLRIKIEDDTANPTYITTVWGLGYKWGA